MLVLSRKLKETIVVNEEITIEILQIKGNQIRIGIVAPREVRVRRGELTPHCDNPSTWVAPEIVREMTLPFSAVQAV
jgi:carbon storage regulator